MKALIAAALMLVSSLAWAQLGIDVGDYRVLYSASNASSLPAKVARQYGITRGRNVAVLTFNVQRRNAQGIYSSVPASGTASVANLIGHRQDVALRNVREDGIDTLVGETRFDDGEFLVIEGTITPNGSAVTMPVRFRQQFYRN